MDQKKKEKRKEQTTSEDRHYVTGVLSIIHRRSQYYNKYEKGWI
jgi:hypothetical protein